MKIQLVDSVKNADTVSHVDDIIAHRQVGKDLISSPLRFFVLRVEVVTALPVVGETKFDLWLLKSSGKGSLQHKNAPITDVFQVFYILGVDAHFSQVSS